MDNREKPVILVADDTLQNLQYLASVIEECGYEPILAPNGTQVLSFVANEVPDLILLDVIMPDINGFDLCRKLKGMAHLTEVPIIFITAKAAAQEDTLAGFDAGGVDYITKPFNSKELVSRMKTHVDLKLSKDTLKKYTQELEKVNKNLMSMMSELENITKTDYLTGLYARRYAIDRIETEKTRFKRNKTPFSIVLADIDHFKRFNDQYGHSCGDYVLKSLAKILMAAVRAQDVVARWGGEEFLFLLPDTSLEGAHLVTNKVKDLIEKSVFTFNEMENLNVTLTFGLDMYDGSDDVDKVIKNADSALYEGKKNGRNCVVIYGEKEVATALENLVP